MNREELIKHYQQKKYIGDSVYVHFDGYYFILETINGYPDNPGNRIALDPYVFEKFMKVREQYYMDLERLRDKEDDS